MQFSFKRSDFPEDFIFGAATAAYQIEGSQFGDCGSSIWDSWATTQGNVVKNDDGSVACDHFNRSEADLDLIKSAGFDTYRFSSSWSRVMPDGKTINPKGLDFYDRLIDGMLERGLKPNLTLYHWDLPSALSDIGGWMNREIPLRFADYTKVMSDLVGDRVDYIATINEPFCAAWLGYFVGCKAPGIKDVRAGIRAIHHIQLAHGLAVQTLRDDGKDNLGIVLNLSHSEPLTTDQKDIKAQQMFDAIGFRWYMDSLFKGHYPQDMIDQIGQYLPDGFEKDMPTINQEIDWLGINYYTRELILGRPDENWPSLSVERGDLPKTDMGWEIYPQGLEALLTRVHEDYTHELPLYVTENGMAHSDSVSENECDDPERVQYFEQHLQKTLSCIDKGVPLKGYYAWSLLDNYEWEYGYAKRFGIVHVNYETQKRTPKSSFKAFRHLLVD